MRSKEPSKRDAKQKRIKPSGLLPDQQPGYAPIRVLEKKIKIG